MSLRAKRRKYIIAGIAAAAACVLLLTGGLLLFRQLTQEDPDVPAILDPSRYEEFAFEHEFEDTGEGSEAGSPSAIGDPSGNGSGADLTEPETEIETEPEPEPDPRLDVLTHYTNLGVVKDVSTYLNVREVPGMDGTVIGKIWKYSGMEILENLGNGWYHISSGEVDGYVAGEFVADGEEAAALAVEHCFPMISIRAERLNVRSAPTVTAEVWTQLNAKELQTFEQKLDNWYEVIINNNTGFVSAGYCDEVYYLNTAIPWSPLDDTTPLRRGIVEYGMEFLGLPYVWGGTDMGSGVDCSGFTRNVFAHFGIGLRRVSYEQVNQGIPVDGIENAQPGDLIFYTDATGTVDHVAIYAGAGKICHAARSRGGVVITSYDYATPPAYIRNIIQD